jgi:hypothetical protein
MEVISKTKITMKRKDYERPATRIVQVQHTGMLMTSDPNQRKKRATMDIEYDEEDI